MNRIGQRLLPAGLLALILHGIALSWQIDQDPETLATPLLVQRIVVSLGVRELARVQAPEAKQVQQPSPAKKILPQARVHKQSPAEKPAVLPDSKASQIARKKPQPQPKTETPRSVPSHKEQNVVLPPPLLQGTHLEDQPTPEHAAPSTKPEIENESVQAPAAAQVIQQASPLYRLNPPPKYPPLAQRRGLEGVVLLEAFIDISGKVAELRLFTSSGHTILDQAALKALRRWRFTPGTVGDKPQEMWVKVPVRFQLR